VEVEPLVRPVIEAEGLELVDATMAGKGHDRVLRVTVDGPDGVDLDRIADLSGRISRHLDAEGFEPGPYALEVSSPGIERPLRRPDQFRRAVGSLVRIKTTVPVAGSSSHEGALRLADEEGVALEVAGEERRVPYADIASARTVADWDAELKRSHA
jgi:ribosome maturation factor RimP